MHASLCVWSDLMRYYFDRAAKPIILLVNPASASNYLLSYVMLCLHGDQISASSVLANYHIGGIIENFFPSKELERFTKPTGELHVHVHVFRFARH